MLHQDTLLLSHTKTFPLSKYDLNLVSIIPISSAQLTWFSNYSDSEQLVLTLSFYELVSALTIESEKPQALKTTTALVSKRGQPSNYPKHIPLHDNDTIYLLAQKKTPYWAKQSLIRQKNGWYSNFVGSLNDWEILLEYQPIVAVNPCKTYERDLQISRA